MKKTQAKHVVCHRLAQVSPAAFPFCFGEPATQKRKAGLRTSLAKNLAGSVPRPLRTSEPAVGERLGRLSVPSPRTPSGAWQASATRRKAAPPEPEAAL